MARINISIPDDLHRQMQSTKRRINWSAIAAEAIAAKLRTEEESTVSITTTVERLRSSKAHVAERAYHEGLRLGMRWAESRAEVEHLERLETARDPFMDWEFNRADSTKAAAEQFCSIIFCTEISEPDFTEKFWAQELKTKDPWEKILHPRFFDGFAEAVMKIWTEIKGKL